MRFPSAVVTNLAISLAELSLAWNPSVVISSPGFKLSAIQPWRNNALRDAVSHFHSSVFPFAPPTAISNHGCFPFPAHSILITVPLRVTGLAGSYSAARHL